MTTLGVFRDDYYEPISILPQSQYKATTQNAGTFVAANLVGAADNYLAASGNTGAQAVTLDTAVNIVNAFIAALQTNAANAFPPPQGVVGSTFTVTIINNNTSSGVITLSGGTGVTITGTNTLAITTSRTFVVTITSLTTVTFQNVGSGTP